MTSVAAMTPERVEEILAGLRAVRVLVVGDLMLDRYLTGDVDRISPEAPVPVVRVNAETTAVGGAGNVAANVAALGSGCEIVGCVGDDRDGRVVLEALAGAGVGVDGALTVKGRPTTVKTRILARRQQVVRVDREQDGDVDDPVAEHFVRAIEGPGVDADVIVLEDYNKGVLVERVIAAALAGGPGRPSVIDPKRLRFFSFAGCTVFKPNAKELSDALGEVLHPNDAAWMEATRQRLRCANLLLTLGEHGVALSTEEGDYVRIPAVGRSIYDVSGAGDTVTAVTAACLGAGASIGEAAVIANHAAAIEVGKAGVATVSPDEILRQYRDSAAGTPSESAT